MGARSRKFKNEDYVAVLLGTFSNFKRQPV